MKKISILIIGILIAMSMITINKIINVSYSIKNLNLVNNYLVSDDSSRLTMTKTKHLAPLPMGSDDVNYYTDQSTDLLSGLISNSGNTKNSYIVQTKTNSSLYIKLRLNMLDLKNSFLIRGIVDDHNNFEPSKNKKKLKIKKQLILSDEGVYHFYLVDIFGNSYDSFLEIGEDNWKLKGQFNDKYLILLSQKLNIQKTEILSNDIKKEEAIGWLQNYKSYINMKFYRFVQMYGKGFNLSMKKDFSNVYSLFLNPKDYINNKINFTNGFIKENKLQDYIIKKARMKLQDSLWKLRNLNIDTRNVVDKETLDSFKKWRKNYYNFITHHKYKWISRIGKIASRGLANEFQM